MREHAPVKWPTWVGQVSVWNDDNLAVPLHEETIDSSSGVIFPYYDSDTNILYLAGKSQRPAPDTAQVP
ncbi:Coronin-2A [Homalodisca vitripennis]|nr:Coronin-2A [Homalodisca vitripennis]